MHDPDDAAARARLRALLAALHSSVIETDPVLTPHIEHPGRSDARGEAFRAQDPGEARATELPELKPERLRSHVQQCLRKAESDPLNAIVRTCPERARAELHRLLSDQRAALPLAGLLLVHKDMLHTAGVATEAGSRVLAGWVPSTDATVVSRLAAAGAICIGKANTHEFATGVTGTVSAAGATCNPWDRQRIPGGSSCGSAAAVAAGLVEAATGTDTGGSIRIPSSCCGVVGFKPTYDLVSRAGVIPFAWSLDHVGPIAATVDTVRALFHAMRQDAPGTVSVPDPSAQRSTCRPLDGLRVAVAVELLSECLEPVAEAIRTAVAVLESQGAQRLDVKLPPTWSLTPAIASATFLAEGGAVHRRWMRAHPEAYQPATRAFLARAGEISGADYVQAQRARSRLVAELEGLLSRADVLVLPTLPTVAPRLDEAYVQLPRGPVQVRAALTLFTRPFNLTGQPALTVPCGFDQGMPIGLQLAAARYRDDLLLQTAATFERHAGWLPRTPPGRVRSGEDPEVGSPAPGQAREEEAVRNRASARRRR